jgi:hypothetical protein
VCVCVCVCVCECACARACVCVCVLGLNGGCGLPGTSLITHGTLLFVNDNVVFVNCGGRGGKEGFGGGCGGGKGYGTGVCW